MLRAVLQRELDGLLVAVDNQASRFRDEHRRAIGLRGVGEEHVAPAGDRLDVADVEHAVRKAREKDARLDVALGPGGDDVERDLAERLVRVGQGDDRFVGRRGARDEGEKRDRTEDPEDADAAGLERDKLAVGREAAQAEQHAVQQRHRNGDAERLRDQRHQDAHDDRPRDALRHQLLAVLENGRHHQHEGQPQQRQQHGRHDLAHEIAVENLQRY